MTAEARLAEIVREMDEANRDYWMDERQALLMRLATLERNRLHVEAQGKPTTSDRCHVAKALERGDAEAVRAYVEQYGQPKGRG